MTDSVTTDDQGRTFKNGVLQVSRSATPGVGGAISDAIGALASSFAPKAITQRKAKVDDATLGNSF
jgi:hypothetical protein